MKQNNKKRKEMKRNDKRINLHHKRQKEDV
jgi:hypothetical protein